MERITLRKALQKKNIKVGRIKELQSLIATKNSMDAAAPESSKVDVHALMIELDRERTLLIDLKSAITVANIGIYPTLCLLEETKSQISFLDTIQTREGTFPSRSFDGIVSNTVIVASISEKDIRSSKESLRAKIESLQEKVDEFNVSTFINVEL